MTVRETFVSKYRKEEIENRKGGCPLTAMPEATGAQRNLK
jgi:hypothetical protein